MGANKVYKKNCVSCFRMTQGGCGDDPVCFECYTSGRYAEWLKEQGRGNELIDSPEQAAEELLDGI